MGQDLRKMIIVYIDGEESVRPVGNFVMSNRYGRVPVPVLSLNEVYFISENGISHIIDISDIDPMRKGWC
jgi:hypothetical protein